MLTVSWDTIRLFLHVLAATIWVGGQLVLAALVPVLRRFGAEALVPPEVRTAHERYRASYLRAPRARHMAERARLAWLRRDRATRPVEISLSSLPIRRR